MNRVLVLIAISILFLSYVQYLPARASAASGAPAVEWSKRYTGATAYAPIVIQTNDGGYAIASTGDFGSGEVWCLVKTDSTGTVEWKKTYGGIPPNIAESLIQTSDGGYAIAGYTNKNPYGNAMLVKTDSNGNIQWSQTYSDGSWTGVWSLVQTNDNGYVMSGNKDYYTGWLIKTDPSGTKQWSQGFGLGNNTQLTSVVQTSDGGYVATGATQFPRFSGKVDAYLVKTDSDGNTVWIKDFSRTTGDDFGRSGIQTSDGGYAIVGETDHFGNADFWLIKTDASGNYLWDKTFGGTGWDVATSIVQTTDGGYALAGQTNSFGAGGNDFWLVKTDADGTMQWNSTYGGAGDDVGTSVIQTLDGGYALCGYTNSFSGDGSYEVWLMKLRGSAPAPVVEWNKTFGGTSEEKDYGTRSLIETDDGGYALVGWTYSYGAGGRDGWLVKTDAYGNIQWNRTYGSVADDDFSTAIQTSDGGYALAGGSWNQSRGAFDLFVVGTDENGNMQWNLTYIPDSSGGGLDWGAAWTMIKTSDGGYIISGSIRHHPNHPTGDWDAWVVKLSSAGHVLWDKPYFSGADDGGGGIIQTADGGYAFVGATGSWGGSGGVIWLVKLDANGSQQWTKTYGTGGGPTDNAFSLVQTPDGGYAIAGYTYRFGAAGGDSCLIRTDSLGNMVWIKIYGGSNEEQARSMIASIQGGYLLAGYTKSYGAGASDFWLFETDSSGTIKWNQTYGGANDDQAYSIIQTTDGGYAVVGYTYSYGAGSSDFWLIKLAGTEPRTWIVDDDGPADFSTIQEAISAANAGDSIFVRNGTYKEHIVIDKSLTLEGENRASTVIDAEYADSRVVDVIANNVKISGFTIQHVMVGGSAVVLDNYVNMTFSDNILTGDSEGIRILHSSGNVISYNDIQGCYYNTGLGFNWAHNNTVYGNIIANNNVGIGGNHWNNTFFNNTIRDNVGGWAGWGISDNFYDCVFYHNNIINNGHQIYNTNPNNNTWDNGYPSGGNYWSDYTGTDTNGDGIGDTPYVINPQNLDNHPLMNEFPSPSKSVAPVADFTYSPRTPIANETVTFDASISKNGWNGTHSVAISTYAWDFGDNSKVTGQVATHTYVMPGNFTVTLNVTDAQGLWNVTQKQIQVGQPHSPFAAFTINPEFTHVGQELVLNASASLPGWNGTHENPITSFTWDFGDGNVTSSANSTIVHSYTHAGNFNVTLTVSDSQNMSSSCSHTILVIMPTSISVSTRATSSLIGYVVSINGTLRDVYGSPIGNEPVVLYYTFPGITGLFPMTSSTTDDNGRYSAQWIPTATGTFSIIAEWTGNITYSEASSNVTMSCVSAMNQYIFSVESNSTISSLAFNTTSLELSFTASGPSGTSGYVKITVAKTLVANITNVRVYLDNNETEFSVASTDNSWVLSFNYSHSTHKLRVDLASTRIYDITGPDGQPDGKCNMRDVGLVARNFGKTVPPAPANCDITGPTAGMPDGIIDMRDIGLIAQHYGERYQ